MKQLLGISLALIMISLVPLGFSEPLRVQLEQGIETNQIQCNNDSHVLVQRNNGNLACVTEKTAERMNWEIVETIPEPTLEEQIEKLENSDRFWFDYQPELYHLNIQLDVRNYIENNNWPKYSEEQVITQATEYINSIDYLFTETEEDGKLCGLVLNENFNVGKMIIDDKPYHNISMGSCDDHDDMGLVGARVAEVIINAENSTDIDHIVYDFGDG